MRDGLAADVRAAQAGDEVAFGRLVEALWADLVRLARSVVGEVDAEDVVQDALVVAWRKLPQLDDPERLRGWLTRSVFRRCLRRSAWNRLRRACALPADHAAAPCDPGVQLDVWMLLANLAPRQRAVMHMTVVEGRSDSEIGEALGLAAASVRAHRRRARERLARLSEAERG